MDIMANEVQNVTEEVNQNTNGSNSEEMTEIEKEEHKLITLHVTQKEKSNLGAFESMHNIMKVVKAS